MTLSRRCFLVSCAALGSSPALALAQRADGSRDLRLLHVIDTSGLRQDMGRDFLTGAKLYFDSANLRGGLNGRRITQLAVQVDGDDTRVIQATIDAVRRERPDALFGLVGDAIVLGVATSEEMRRLGTPILSPIAGAPFDDLTNVVATRASRADEVREVLRQMNGLGTQRIAVAVADDEPASVVDALRQTLDSFKLPGYRLLRFKSDPLGLVALTRETLRERMQMLVLVGDTFDLIEAENSLRGRNDRPQLVGLSQVNHRVLTETLGTSAAGIMLAQVMPNPLRPSLPITREHARLLAQFFDEPPSHQTLEGYFAARVFAEAVATINGAVTPPGLLNAYRALRGRDIAGLTIDLGRPQKSAMFVELSVVRKDGRIGQ